MTARYPRVAVQEDMLPGPTLEERFAQAADLGVGGIEFWSASLPAQADEIARLSGRDGVVASSVNHGSRSRFLDPDPQERARAMAELGQAIALAGGVGAAGVVCVPHFFGPLLPDLAPYKSAVELERGLLTAQIELLLEEVERAGIQLWLEPVNRYETQLLVRLRDAASVVAPFPHPQLGIVADLFHMALDEPDIPAAILATNARAPIRLVIASGPELVEGRRGKPSAPEESDDGSTSMTLEWESLLRRLRSSR